MTEPDDLECRLACVEAVYLVGTEIYPWNLQTTFLGNLSLGLGIYRMDWKLLHSWGATSET